jgi:hypothetical protein
MTEQQLKRLHELCPPNPKRCPVEYMPTDWQAFVFRMWGRLTPRRIASVLSADEAEIIKAAEEMGLGAPASDADEREWTTKGYITLIRDSWHLADYDQIREIVSMTPDELFYTIKEDDFLHVKLGGFKPDVPRLKVTPLSSEQKLHTAGIKAISESFDGKVGEYKSRPFDFSNVYKRPETAADLSGGIRLAYSYCALYGDVFTSNVDYCFSDELLAAYRGYGVNGIWCQAVLYRLAPYPFHDGMDDGWEERLAGLRALTERLAGYGIKLYLYLNEPRALPSSYFSGGTHDDIKGHTSGGLTSLCISSEPVKKYLYDTARFIAGKAPLLGGFMTISGSENLTHCYSHTGEPDCPRCSKRPRAEVTAECNNLLYRGASSVIPDFRFIAWTWGWPDDMVGDITEKLDRGIILSEVSEHRVEKIIGGVKTSVSDYSISVVGPGEHALASWKKARELGHQVCAKTQLNCCWEEGSLPFIPVFDTVALHLCRLKAAGVENLILDWTVGGYPSPTFALASLIMGQENPEREAVLTEFYEKFFPESERETIKAASAQLSAAYDNWPFEIGVLYNGPQHMGPANPIHIEPTGLWATMTCWPHDCLNAWRAIYPEEVFENQLKLLSDGWDKGVETLKQLKGQPLSSMAEDILVCAEAAAAVFRSMYIQTRFIRLRGDIKSNGEELIKLLDAELRCIYEAADAQSRHPGVGFESTNHYFFTRQSLKEAAISCEYAKKLIKSH